MKTTQNDLSSFVRQEVLNKINQLDSDFQQSVESDGVEAVRVYEIRDKIETAIKDYRRLLDNVSPTLLSDIKKEKLDLIKRLEKRLQKAIDVGNDEENASIREEIGNTLDQYNKLLFRSK